MLRDGGSRSEDKYFRNKLDQQWVFESETGQIAFRYSLYLFYWYKSTNTNAEGAFSVENTVLKSQLQHSYKGGAPQDNVTIGTKSTSFTGLALLVHKCKILMQKALLDIQIKDEDKDTLDYLFHPGGGNAPKQVC
jgi:hypothetical protein